jgi:hypothetical protein
VYGAKGGEVDKAGGLMNRDEESRLIMIAARWEAVCEALKGKEPSDFMLSFPEVRRVWDLYWVEKAYS